MTSSTQNNPGCLSAVLQAIGLKPKVKTIEKLPYQLKGHFLSPAELSFYHVLSSIIAPKITVCPKIRLADIISVSRKKEYYTYFNKISSKHIDFLLCQADTMQPILAIELDDSSHNRQRRQERDEFVNKAFKAIGLPLVRFPAQRAYVTKDLSIYLSRIQGIISPPGEETVGPPQADPISEQDTTNHPNPTCPKCSSPMVVRTVKTGEHQGKQFYGCSTYPKCRGVLPLESEESA